MDKERDGEQRQKQERQSDILQLVEKTKWKTRAVYDEE